MRSLLPPPVYKYDPEAGALYILINPYLPRSYTTEYGDELNVDCSDDGSIVGIELLNVKDILKEEE